MPFDLNLCNAPNYKKRGDYGIRVARPGYDSFTCSQNQLVFNSNWPIIQITDVIDLNKNVETKYVWVNSDNEWTEEEPSISEYHPGAVYGSGVAVGKNYVWIECENSNGVDSDNKYWNRIAYKKIRHGLGYQPMYYRSEDISNISGYLVLTSVCLSVDVDYPYTEGPTMFLGSTKDYGIAATSKFGKRVPGLRSDMFSKLIQAVKTEKTCKQKIKIMDPETGDLIDSEEAGIIYWSPLNNLDGEYKGCLEPYEAVAYTGALNPFGRPDVNFTTISPKFGNDGPYYRDDQDRVRAVPYSDVATGSVFGDGVAFTTLGQATYRTLYKSMVVIRSPMVSPEYEEIVI